MEDYYAHETASRQYLRVAEVALELGVSEKTVWRRVWAGELAVVRFGRGRRAPVLVPRGALANYLAGVAA
jgi:excisionase family DNA binding protein